MATIDIVRTILHDNLDVDPETVTEETTFESLKIDSLDMVELICNLEDELGIDFGEPEGLTNIGELVVYVDDLVANK